MPRLRRSLLAIAALAGAACSDASVGGGLDAPITPIGARIWAGSTLQLRSQSFRDHGDGATFVAGATSIPLVRVNDTTMSVTLPTTMGGSVSAHIDFAGTAVALPALQIAGFASIAQPPGADIVWDVYATTRNGHAAAVGTTGVGLVFVDLETATTSAPVAGSNYSWLRGPGATYQDGVYLLRAANDPVASWDFTGATPTKVATHPVASSTRQAMRLGPNAWFVSTSNQFQTLVRTNDIDPYITTTTVATETEGVYMSPRHDRATIAVDRVLSGVPVYDVPSGNLAYTLTELKSVQGVAFAPDGAQFALAGGSVDKPEDPGRVLLVDAASGSVQRTVTLDRSVFGVAIDPARSVVYVGVNQAVAGPVEARPSIVVLDKATFAVVGEMAVPSTAMGCQFGSCYKGVMSLGSDGALYMFWSFNGPARVYKFALPAH